MTAFAPRTKHVFIENAATKAPGLSLPPDLAQAIGQAIEGDDAAVRVTFRVSNDNPDLDTDVMTLPVLQKMAALYKGRTFFLNHDWSVPRSVFGTIEDTFITQEEQPLIAGGARLANCLYATVRVAQSNPDAVMTYNLIARDAITLGSSITILILDEREDKQNGVNLILDIYPLEISVVGVPANQNAWVDGGGKGFVPTPPTKGKAMTTEITAPVAKGLWEQSRAEQEATSWETFYDLTSALRDGTDDLIELCEMGKCADPAAELKALVSGFANDYYALVLPALETVATPPAVSLSAARAILGAVLQKAGAALSKDNLANLESIHDSAHASETAAAGTAAKCYAMHKGLTCAKCKATADMDEAGAATGDDGATETAKGVHVVYAEREALQRSVHSLTTENTDLKTKTAELAAANTDLEEDARLAWTSLEIATAALQKFKNEPMPAA